MLRKFDYFVIFAEMRTGSNLLESKLNMFVDLQSVGEAFNPNFIGTPKTRKVMEVSLLDRAQNPIPLLEKIKQPSQTIHGFRYFHDHDPRVLLPCLLDLRCAKIILTRNPVESYISWKIARQTGQWKLQNINRRKENQKIAFDAKEFSEYLTQIQNFNLYLNARLQTTGQTAFQLNYEDLQNQDVINGTAQFLGSTGEIEAVKAKLLPQNPVALSEKVENFPAMQAELAQIDRFNLARVPDFEPRRRPVISHYIATSRGSLLFMPVRSGPVETISQWLAALDDVDLSELLTAFDPPALKSWQQAHPGHRSFTVIRHPVARAHYVFCTRILSTEPQQFSRIRNILGRFFHIKLPENANDHAYDLAAHRTAFMQFLRFLSANLTNQTNIRIDPNWASQSQIIRAMAYNAHPDMIIRENEMDVYLRALALQTGYSSSAKVAAKPSHTPFTLDEVYDDQIEALAQTAYATDYTTFGFGKFK